MVQQNRREKKLDLTKLRLFIYLRFISHSAKEFKVLTYPINLPGTHDSVVKSVGHVEDISFPEAHLAFVWLVIVKMSSATGKQVMGASG